MKSLTDIFMDTLNKRELNEGHKNYEIYSVFIIIFEMLSDEGNVLEYMLNEAYRERRKAGWFYNFHKTIRNSDTFTNCFQINPNPTIEPTEQKEYNRLDKEWDRVAKLMQKWEGPLLDKLPIETDPTYVQKSAEHQIAYKLKFKSLYPEEKNKRRRYLLSKIKDEEKESINGKISAILWCMVHVDKDNVLTDALKRTFNEYNFLKSRAKNKKRKVTV